jgi:hypothetical protein
VFRHDVACCIPLLGLSLAPEWGSHSWLSGACYAKVYCGAYLCQGIEAALAHLYPFPAAPAATVGQAVTERDMLCPMPL